MLILLLAAAVLLSLPVHSAQQARISRLAIIGLLTVTVADVVVEQQLQYYAERLAPAIVLLACMAPLFAPTPRPTP